MTETGPAIDDIIFAALFATDRPLGREELAGLFAPGEAISCPDHNEIEAALGRISERLSGLPLDLRRLASGYRLEVSPNFSPWVSRLWVERPARYSRALLETLALIAYRQPITRPEIEAVRGVAVNTQIIRTLGERGWIRIVGHRDTPGRPAIYGTTKAFLDYFGLADLDELPSLAAIRDLSEIEPELPLESVPDTVETPGQAVPGITMAKEEVAVPQAGSEEAAILPGPWPPKTDGGDESF